MPINLVEDIHQPFANLSYLLVDGTRLALVVFPHFALVLYLLVISI